MKDYPLTAFTEGTKSALGGVIAFLLGLAGGTLLLTSSGLIGNGPWLWYFIAPIGILPYTIARLWGLLLAPILGVIFLGLIWMDWNRIVCGSLVALLYATTTLICAKHNPFIDGNTANSFLALLACAFMILFAGIAWEWKQRRRRPT